MGAAQPLNAYGRSKLEGEKSIRAAACAHLILRMSGVYAARGRNFVLTMLRRDSGHYHDPGAALGALSGAHAAGDAPLRWLSVFIVIPVVLFIVLLAFGARLKPLMRRLSLSLTGHWSERIPR
jgi:RmlD substrate binding domain